MTNRFQFRLRTLMIGVALLAIPCAYVGWQAKIVRDRKAVARWIEERNGDLSDNITTPLHGPYQPQVSWLRRTLGDKGVADVLFPKPLTDDDKQRIKDAFPEAELSVGYRVDTAGYLPPRQSFYPSTQP